ncbi:MAG: ABC transporter substrate-binding protein [Beijerinckiaceae bacterium]
MKRRDFIGYAGALVGAAPFAAPPAARAQQPGRQKVIGVTFSSADNTESRQRAEAFRNGLKALGWNEGKEYRLEFRSLGNDSEKAKTLGAELIALSPDVILSSGTVATTAMRSLTRDIPVVFVNVTDPVAGGFVASLAHPGGNMTGLTPFDYPIAAKWLQLIREIDPRVTRAALMGDPNNHNFKGFWSPFAEEAKRLSIEPIQLAAPDAGEIERGVAGLAATPGAGLIVSAAAFSLVHRKLIVDLAAQHKVPAIYWSRFFAQAGGLMAYGPDTMELHRQAAGFVDRILRGEKPEALPVERAIAYELVVNARTARALGVDPPAALMARAEEVIE